MKRSIGFPTLLTLVLTLVLALPGFAGSLDKARDFMKAGMNKQAESLLEQEINENPANAEAHFLLGKCYLSLDEFRSIAKAEDRFSSAVKLNSSKYAYKIADVYIEVGMEKLGESDKNKAERLFERSRKYHADSDDKIAQKCFRQGKEFLARGAYSGANDHFSVAAEYDSSLRSDIAQLYYQKYQQNEELRFLKRASSYDSSSYGEEYARKSLKQGMDVSQSEWEERAKEAKEYLSEQEILQLSFDYYTQKWGEPQKVVLDDNKWKKVCEIQEGDKVHFLSLYGFKDKYGNKWDRAFTSEYTSTFYGVDKGGEIIRIKERGHPVTVFFWKNKK